MNDKVQHVISDYKQKLGSIRDLCEKHGISQANFYRLRPRNAKFRKPATKRKYKKTPTVLDIPLQAKTEFVIICRAEDAAKVMGSL